MRRQRVVHLLHVPKTGGTAVKTALGRCRIPRDVRLVRHGHLVRLRDIPERDHVAFFIRDPVARYVSSFNDRLREGRPGHVSPWDDFERAVFKRFPTPESLAIALSSDDPEMRAEAARAMQGTHLLRARLTDWLGDPDFLRSRRHQILLVGRQEMLEADFGRMKSMLGITSRCELPTDKNAHRAPGTQAVTLSEEAAATMREWFALDQELIDICLEDVAPS